MDLEKVLTGEDAVADIVETPEAAQEAPIEEVAAEEAVAEAPVEEVQEVEETVSEGVTALLFSPLV